MVEPQLRRVVNPDEPTLQHPAPPTQLSAAQRTLRIERHEWQPSELSGNAHKPLLVARQA